MQFPLGVGEQALLHFPLTQQCLCLYYVFECCSFQNLKNRWMNEWDWFTLTKELCVVWISRSRDPNLGQNLQRGVHGEVIRWHSNPFVREFMNADGQELTSSNDKVSEFFTFCSQVNYIHFIPIVKLFFKTILYVQENCEDSTQTSMQLPCSPPVVHVWCYCGTFVTIAEPILIHFSHLRPTSFRSPQFSLTALFRPRAPSRVPHST